MANNQGVPVHPLTGGLDLKSPPTRVAPGSSPDLDNVALHNMAVERRGGFTPFIRQTSRLNAIQNRGRHGRAAENTTGPPFPDTDYLIVPGGLYAGHRDVLDDLVSETTLEFFLRIDDLTNEHGGNGESGAVPWGPAPYQLFVRPILSKGPVKRTQDPTTTGYVAGGASQNWQVANPYGATNTTRAMPWAIWLQNTSVLPGVTWRFHFAVHARQGATWALEFMTSSIEPRVGAVYHVIATVSFSGKIMRLRIGEVTDANTIPTYVYNTHAMNAASVASTGNLQPVQVFDMPQHFVEQGAGTATLPAGLGFNAAAQGGYWFAAKRFEGAIEDIAIHQGDLLAAAAGALDRNTKYDPEALPATVRQFWSMTEPGMEVVPEMTGQGNHLYFSPRGPIHDGVSGGVRKGGSWWFNGQTSYAIAKLGEGVKGFLGATDDGNPNWRYFFDETGGDRDEAAMQSLVKTNEPHGIGVEFWCDAIEPNFEQVLIEIHSVLRLAIETDGTLVGYCRDNSSNVGVKVIPQYQATRVVSNDVVQPGRRYHVVLLRHNGGQDMSIFINGVLDANVGGLAASDPDGQPIGGLTIGMGQYRPTTDTTDLVAQIEPVAETGANEQINTDHRSGFMGRMEAAFVICGDGKRPPVYRDQQETDWRLEQARLWEHVGGPPGTALRADDANDLVSTEVGDGAVVAPSGDAQLGVPLRYALDDAGNVNPAFYVLPAGAPAHHELRLIGTTAAPTGGAYTDARQVLTYFVLGRWVMDRDDRLNGTHGRYSEAEYRNHASATLDHNVHKLVHQQVSTVKDELGALGPLERRCVESDVMSDADATFGARGYQHRLRPYKFSSPWELGPKWAKGLAFPRSGQTHVSLLADWEHEETGERFLLTATGRSLYWARQIWRRASPFAGEPDTLVPWSFGSEDSYIRLPHGHASQGLTAANDIEIDFWIYPQRLDGRRLLVFRGELSTSATSGINYLIYLEDGSLNFVGTQTGGTVAHRIMEAAINNSPRPGVSLKANAWNYVVVSLSSAGGPVVFTVNGIVVPTTAVAGWTARGAGGNDAATEPVHLLGLPAHAAELTIQKTTGPTTQETIRLEGFQGYITAFRLRNSLALPTLVPATRPADDASTYYLQQLDDGTGWTFLESAATVAGQDGVAHLDELVCIHEGLDESRGAPYRGVAYRNAFYVTNGRSDPHWIRFRSFTDPRGPFEVTRLGMAAPARVGRTFITLMGNTNHASAVYQMWMSFLDRDGLESDPALLFARTIGPFDTLLVANLPRSPDPQVVGRRFYLSPDAGGQAIQHLDLPDNTSYDWEFELPATGLAVETGRRLPAPRAKQIAVGQGSMWLANLTDIPAGRNAFQVSDGASVAWWPGLLLQAVDSEDGKAIVAMNSMLGGRVYLHKRDSVWEEQLGGTNLPIPFNVNPSIGIGGGATTYDNGMYGAGDKGVHLFSGADVQYASRGLEADYRDLDLDDEAIELFWGIYWWPDSHYWLSVRERGRATARRLYVLHTDLQTIIAGFGQQPWSRWTVPDHTYLGTILDPNTREPVALLGTPSGQILRYDPDNTVDVAPASGTLTGTASATSAASLTMAGAVFDTIGPGLRGAIVRITDTDGTVYEREIERNTSTALFWTGNITFVGLPSFEIGGYESYWTSPWFAFQREGKFEHLESLDFTFDPSPATLEVLVQSAIGAVPTQRAWPTATQETLTLDMTSGWQEQTLRVRNATRGRYHRIRFGLRTPLQRFSVSAYQPRVAESGQRGGRSA